MSATSSSPRFTKRNAIRTDLPRILALLPLLADFNIPENRHADDLWSADARLAADILSDKAASAFIDVAEDSDGDIAGVIMVSLREELLSHVPSAHLEAIVVSPNARGRGLGKRLMQHCEQRVRAMGALSLSLHVFTNN
ncbi:MAG: GNAT family N-acetyltransferase, partial [Pseudomonadota bacterium]|nr:GNAT family N-acetyltransferase [Pseudomonadota bacterium]